MTELIVTTGKEWRQKVGVVLRLPSGRVARIRAVGPDMVLQQGNLPDSLTPIIANIMDGQENDAKVKTMDDLVGMTDFLNLVTRCAFVDPRIVDKPSKDNEIGIDDVDWPDKEFLMGVIGASTSLLEDFRRQQESNVDDLVSAKGHDESGEPDSKSE
jgi:hypothetical protein